MKWADRIGVWCSDYREIFHAIIAVVALKWAYENVQLVDSRVSFDGWSDLLYLLTRAAQGFAIVLFAWMSKTATHGELTGAEDHVLRARIQAGDRGAVWMYSLDMVSTAFWVGLWAWIVLGAH